MAESALRISVDVGANRGHYAEDLSSLSLHCHAFECNPNLATFLRNEFVQVPNVTVHDIALSDKSEIAQLTIPIFHHKESDGGSTLAKTVDFGWADKIKKVEVPTATLDSFKLANVGFIKIDVEGHELAVLRGALQTIHRDRPKMLIECEDRHNLGGIEKLSNLMSKIGYHVYFFSNDRLHPLKDFDVAKHQNPAILASDKPRRQIPYINNFICLPEAVDASKFGLKDSS